MSLDEALNECRETFEAEFRRQGHWHSLKRDGSRYFDIGTQNHWKLWQAAWNRPSDQEGLVGKVEALRETCGDTYTIDKAIEIFRQHGAAKSPEQIYDDMAKQPVEIKRYPMKEHTAASPTEIVRFSLSDTCASLRVDQGNDNVASVTYTTRSGVKYSSEPEEQLSAGKVGDTVTGTPASRQFESAAPARYDQADDALSLMGDYSHRKGEDGHDQEARGCDPSTASDSVGSPVRYTDGTTSREYEEQSPIDAGQHEWHMRFKLECCKKCGIVKRADGKNKPCKGIVKVGLRQPSPVLDLHARDKVVFQILTGDPALMGTISGVYERIPQCAAFPYVTFGNADEKFFRLSVWVRERGRKQATTIMERLHTLLLPAFQFVSSKISLEADGWTYQGEMTFGSIGPVSASLEKCAKAILEKNKTPGMCDALCLSRPCGCATAYAKAVLDAAGWCLMSEIDDAYQEGYGNGYADGKKGTKAPATGQPTTKCTCHNARRTLKRNCPVHDATGQPDELIEGIKTGIAEARALFAKNPDDFNGELSDDDLVAFIHMAIHRCSSKRESGPQWKPGTDRSMKMWNTLPGDPVKHSLPLLFKTVIDITADRSSPVTHLRLGYYDGNRDRFVESGDPLEISYRESVECWYQFPMPLTEPPEGRR